MEQKKRIPLWKVIAAIVLRLVILVLLVAVAGVAFLSIVEYYDVGVERFENPYPSSVLSSF